MQSKLLYGVEVKIVYGFYKGLCGIATGYDYTTKLVKIKISKESLILDEFINIPIRNLHDDFGYTFEETIM